MPDTHLTEPFAVITVLYFAHVAELTGTRQESWPLDAPISAAQWLEQVQARYPALGSVQRLKIAINQYHANHTAEIRPGDEVAVFEPVTGG
ncbi:MAG: MoaD/ThiS family protein [Alcaligenaceae bacterium]|nr:MoaD/ThiS family protein [Alcaligenaceae bacterium]